MIDEKIYQKGKTIALPLVEKYHQRLYLVNVYRDQRAVAWVLNDKDKCLNDEQIYQKKDYSLTFGRRIAPYVVVSQCLSNSKGYRLSFEW